MTDRVANFNHTKKMKKELKTVAFILKLSLFRIWDVVSMLLSDEPRIRQEHDRFGKTYWYIYDPICDRSFRFTSEQEVRQWLEKRFSNR